MRDRLTTTESAPAASQYTLKRWLSIMCLGLMILESNGCSRSFWRKQADKDSYNIINQKQVDGRWALPRAEITPDPRSRFYDPFDPDCSPLPPDDPAANSYMKCSNGIPGYKSWHEFGQTMTVENPQWREPFDLHTVDYDPDTGEYKGNLPSIQNMKLPEAIELSYIHNRDYQTQLENLYLSALDLTFERFRFQVRYLGFGNEPSSELTYTNIPGTADNLGMSNQIGVRQFLPTGGQWIVGLTNNTLWLFSGNNRATSASVLSYSLVQPLLLNAGRKVAMESLTQAERNVLYQTRTLARFRKTLFTNTVSGGGNASGYLDLLEQIQGIRNQRQSVSLLEDRVESLRALSTKPAGRTIRQLNRMPAGLVVPDSLQEKLKFRPVMGKNINNMQDEIIGYEMIWFGSMSEEEAATILGLSKDPEFQQAASELQQILIGETITLDVAQLESTLRNSRNTLRSREVSLRDNLDRYKIALGLPPDIVMTIDESLLDQFQFIDPLLIDLEKRITNSIDEIGQLDPDAEVIDVELMKQLLAILYGYQQELELKCIPIIDKDVELVRENLKNKPESLDKSGDKIALYTENNFKDDVAKYESIKLTIQDAGKEIKNLANQLVNEKMTKELLKENAQKIYAYREDLKTLNFSLQVNEINFRVQMVDLNEFDLPLDMCVGLAVENRLDLMNQRAVVMDNRRQMEVIANRLKGVMDLVVEGDIRNEPGSNNPVDFRGSSSSFRAGVAFQAPLDQAAERNAYRETLINYQRSKRDYMLAEDNVKAAVRSSWRQLQVLKQNLETARQALRYAALQYDQAAELATAPTRPGQSSQGGVQGRNLISAIQSVLSAQNDLVGIWVDYERLRLNIYRDMDIMVIDSRGVWEDNFYQELAQESRLGDPVLPPPAPDNFVIPLNMQEVPPSPTSDLKAVSFENETPDQENTQEKESGPTLREETSKGSHDEFQRNNGERPSNNKQHVSANTDVTADRHRPGRRLFSRQ